MTAFGGSIRNLYLVYPVVLKRHGLINFGFEFQFADGESALQNE